MLSLSPSDASLTLYTLLSTAKALAMALHYLRTLSTVSPHPTTASLGWHDLASLFLDIHIFSDLFLLISTSATQSLCHGTGYPFPKPCSETLNQISSLSPLVSPHLPVCSPWIYIWLQEDHYPRISCLHFPCWSWLLPMAPRRNHSLTSLLHSCALCSLHTIWKISSWINTICEFSCWEVSGENQAAFWIFIVINLNNLPATVNLPAFL